MKKAHAPKPAPSDITYQRVYALMLEQSQRDRSWMSVNLVIDLMNGWDGQSTFQNKSFQRARKKLLQNPGVDTHERPTSSQASAMRKQLDLLVEAKLVEKERGHTDGNNSWGYRWITTEIQAEYDEAGTKLKESRALAREVSLALGGDGESGVQPLLTPDRTIAVRVTMREVTARRLLEALKQSGFSSDFFTGKHWEILTMDGKDVQGCTADRGDARGNDPDARFREVKIADCQSCHGDESAYEGAA